MDGVALHKRVCYIFQDQYPWDVRVEKISDSLAQQGVEVHIVSRNRDGLARTEPYRDQITIHRLSKGFHPVVRDLLNFPAFFSPFWLKAIVSSVWKTASELIIVRDLPLAITAWIAGKMTRRPVLLDMAENYPAMIQDTWTYRGPQGFDYLIRNPALLRSMERFILPKMDGVLVVSEASAARVGNLGVPKETISVVGNTPSLQRGVSHSFANEIRERSDFILIYVGGLEETRGLDTLIRAIPRVAEVEPNVLVVLVGKGTSEPMLRQLTRALGLEKHLLWMGWQDPKSVPSLIQAADVCLVPHYVTEHTDTTIPNKIFDYMLQKKPVIVTHAKTLSEIVDFAQCGLVYKDHRVDELSEAIIQLRSRELRRKMGEAGYQAVLSRYNWDHDSRRLIEAVLALTHPPQLLCNGNART
ncbi:glycosyltransferase family 4 protein [Candidatus Manganitrophus noduliformans]|nr:glycosyltransferase family 4 protein [Candidatus Manganitrophus noduliformans]